MPPLPPRRAPRIPHLAPERRRQAVDGIRAKYGLSERHACRIPDLPVILASGYSHVLAQESANRFELLHKPYSADQVSRMLRKVAGRRRRRAMP
ncbi:DNA-binding NtrC family response regulator [Methylobacterium sp. RAS18]|nr:DNA-binding NtrC family response regulator [Methylobacterium sp. RAS18]